MSIEIISIPDLNETPYIIQGIVLNNRTYYFEYRWSVRWGGAYFSLYKIKNQEKIYLVRNIQLCLENVLSKNINDEDWDGILSFESYLNKCKYNQQNISSEYYINFSQGDNTSAFEKL